MLSYLLPVRCNEIFTAPSNLLLSNVGLMACHNSHHDSGMAARVYVMFNPIGLNLTTDMLHVFPVSTDGEACGHSFGTPSAFSPKNPLIYLMKFVL
jgi:hypothetical protein